MEKIKLSEILLAVGVLSLGAAMLLIVFLGAPSAKGAAPSGLPASIASSSLQTVTTSARLLFATSTSCAARIITTKGTAINLTFSDKTGIRPGATAGAVQAASTTVAYDGGLYGCDAVYAYSYASQVLDVYEAY